jgi:hypothetical protein
MSIIHNSPFSEVREKDRQVTLLVIATSALAACGTLIAAMLVAVGAGACAPRPPRPPSRPTTSP